MIDRDAKRNGDARMKIREGLLSGMNGAETFFSEVFEFDPFQVQSKVNQRNLRADGVRNATGHSWAREAPN